MKQTVVVWCVVLSGLLSFEPPAVAQSESPGQSRSFTFHYQFRVKGLSPSKGTDDIVRIWLPRPMTSEFQKVAQRPATAPAEIAEHDERRFGNRILYLECSVPPSGEFTVDIPYEVVRYEVLRGPSHSRVSPVEKLDGPQRALLLGADKLVPIQGKSLKLLDAVNLRKDPLDKARQFV